MMTNEQFDALAELLRLRGGASQEAARLVLVNGLDRATAAQRAGVTADALRKCLKRCEEGLALARIACGA